MHLVCQNKGHSDKWYTSVMMRKLRILIAVVVSVGVLSAFFMPQQSQAESCDTGYICGLDSLFSANDIASAASEPSWYSAIVPLKYRIETRGDISVDMEAFATQVGDILGDSRGWLRLGLRFSETSGPADFVVMLASAETVPTFSDGCSTYYSCTVGDYVIVNQARWLDATQPWNDAGGSIGDYRHMVINHELGHWLGHPHIDTCPAVGTAAPVMMQQSTALYGCTFNPWPLDDELWSTRL